MSESSSRKKGMAKLTVLSQARTVESNVSRNKANWLLNNAVSNVSQPVLLAFGLWAAITLSAGADNFQRPPAFSVGFWFDDQFAISAVFAAFLISWGGEYVKDALAKRAIVVALAAFYVVGAYSLLTAYTLTRIIGALAALGLAGLHGKALLTYLPEPSVPSNTVGTTDCALARLAVLANAGVLGFAVFLRLTAGVASSATASMPDQPQVRLAPFFVAIIAALLALSARTTDLAFLRTTLATGAFLSLACAGIFSDGNIKPSWTTMALHWAFRGGLALQLFLLSQKPLGNPLYYFARAARMTFGKLGRGSEGYGDE